MVTNIATNPAETVAREIELSIALPTNTVSNRPDGALPTAPVAPAPKQPTYDKHNKSLRQQRADTAKMVADQMESDKRSLNPNASGATRVKRLTMVPPCTDPFLYQVCGPHMLISLEIVPGTYVSPGVTTAQGGIAAQVFGGLQAMSRTSMWDTEPVMRDLVAQLEQIDGSSVSIAFPLIDYGFSGSFDNASIHVKMSGDRVWRAIGPPNASGWSRLIGQVTIEEYTPLVLRGSFTAPLAEFVPSGSDAPAVYVRRDTVRGTFHSVAPWQTDERAQIITVDSKEQMAEDIANTLGFSLDPDMVPGAAPSSDGGSPGSGDAARQTTPECACECEIKPLADELCEMLCEEEFAACD